MIFHLDQIIEVMHHFYCLFSVLQMLEIRNSNYYFEIESVLLKPCILCARFHMKGRQFQDDEDFHF